MANNKQEAIIRDVKSWSYKWICRLPLSAANNDPGIWNGRVSDGPSIIALAEMEKSVYKVAEYLAPVTSCPFLVNKIFSSTIHHSLSHSSRSATAVKSTSP